MDGRSLTDEDVRAIAEQVADLVAHRRLVSAKTLAALLDISPEWVLAHAAELGAIPLGDGPRPRLRFDPEVAQRAIRERAGGQRGSGVRNVGEPEVQPRRPRARRAA